ncbi:hypothetical protein [Acidithiobacillus sp. AMEEHan]|uniref:hypothetical protein n=1 Tax=Acidithiobacillus sp. AMEEHan TaxID=2994951 RepID=UPI0027E48771|nr:hypothetical protein [Acidithiobacillus sp. AMEEHan]
MKLSLLRRGIAVALVLLPLSSMADSVNFALVKKITLPTVDGHGDLLRYDPGNQQIYASMARSGGAVINTKTHNISHIIQGGIENPSGMSWDKNYVYWTSNAKSHGHPDDQIYVVSKQNWKVVYHFHPVGLTPDAIYANEKNHRLYVVMNDSNWIDIYSLGEKPVYLGQIPLYPTSGSGPDVGVLRAKANLLYIPDDSWEETIDLKTNKIIAKVNTALPGSVGESSHTKGQVYDEKTGDLWVGTTKGGILVLNASNLKIIKRLPSKAGIDEVALDPKYQLIYAFESKGKGFNVYNAKTLQLVGFVKTGYLSTHTGAVNPQTHEIYAYAGMDHTIFVYRPISSKP